MREVDRLRRRDLHELWLGRRLPGDPIALRIGSRVGSKSGEFSPRIISAEKLELTVIKEEY